MLYDVFVCHASEDKDAFVRPLAAALRDRNIEVWLDDSSLGLGDSIRRAIDAGLRQSRFAVVVLSPAFFEKNWPQYELDGLVERETAGSDRVILPIWYNVDHGDVLSYSPSLANRRAGLAKNGIDSVVEEIARVVRPQGSPLIVARDLLVAHGVTPPVITDEFWLDVVEASNRVPGYGAAIPDEAHWDRWSFPLTWSDGSPEARGQRLAETALQLAWTSEADRIPISVITEPRNVLQFIRSQPGLLERCAEYPDLTAEYAPQLTIPGFGGELEPIFDEAYLKSIAKAATLRAASPQQGRALTETNEPPSCDEEWCLRDPKLGGFQSNFVADAYFHGGMFGPQVAFHQDADHLIWLLSDRSNWLPSELRGVLLDGLARCTGRWPWPSSGYDHCDWPSAGKVQEALHRSRDRRTIVWSREFVADWHGRIQRARHDLKLPESTEQLFARVRASGIVDRWREASAGIEAIHKKAEAGQRPRRRAAKQRS